MKTHPTSTSIVQRFCTTKIIVQSTNIFSRPEYLVNLSLNCQSKARHILQGPSIKMKMFNLGSPIAQDCRGYKGSYCTLLKARRLNFDKYWGKQGVVPQLQNCTLPKLIFARAFPSTEGSFLRTA